MSADEYQRVRTRAGLFGRDSLNRLDRERLDLAELEDQRAQVRQQLEQEQERREQDLARAGATEQIVALRAELSALREEYESLSRIVADTLRATSDAFGTLADERREQCAEFENLKTAITKLGSTDGRKEAFQFAREKGGAEVVDLPSFLSRRTVN
jgi:chromosome segregation ATPase